MSTQPRCHTTSPTLYVLKPQLMDLTYLDAHGLGEPLDDGEERVGGEHGSLVRLRVDELAHVAGRWSKGLCEGQV